MTPDQRFVSRSRRFIRALSGALLLALSVQPLARADDLGGVPTPIPESDEPVSARTEILHVMQDVQRKYGSDAVIMEGHLLGHAIRNGSILEAVISVPGIEERDTKRFLGFKLETGIIYNDRESEAQARAAKAWSDIVDASLRKFRTVTVPADGIVLTIGYTHKPYTDEADLRTHLADGHGEAESAVFYLLLSDIAERITDGITSQQLIDRSTVLVNGAPARIILNAPTPSR